MASQIALFPPHTPHGPPPGWFHRMANVRKRAIRCAPWRLTFSFAPVASVHSASANSFLSEGLLRSGNQPSCLASFFRSTEAGSGCATETSPWKRSREAMHFLLAPWGAKESTGLPGKVSPPSRPLSDKRPSVRCPTRRSHQLRSSKLGATVVRRGDGDGRSGEDDGLGAMRKTRAWISLWRIRLQAKIPGGLEVLPDCHPKASTEASRWLAQEPVGIESNLERHFLPEPLKPSFMMRGEGTGVDRKFIYIHVAMVFYYDLSLHPLLTAVPPPLMSLII